MVRPNSFFRITSLLLLVTSVVNACPYCSKMGSTITLDIEAFDVVVVGSANDEGRFEIYRVLKGADQIHEQSSVELPNVAPGFTTIGFGKTVAIHEISWEDSRPIGRDEFQYVVGALEAIAQQPIDLPYFFPFLGHRSNKLADDAFYQFARSEYSTIHGHKNQFDRDPIISLISAPETMPELRALAFQLLGMIGTESDAHLPLSFMESADASHRRSLATVMASYLSLAGEPGLEKLKNDYLAKDVKYELTNAAMNAIRFHLQETNQIDRQSLLNALQTVLDNPEIADVVIPDLIAAEDWTAVEKIAQLFRNAPPETRWLRVAAAKYLLAAPQSATGDLVPTLRSIDESAFVEAETGIAQIPSNSAEAISTTSDDAIDIATFLLRSPILAATVLSGGIALLALMSLRILSKRNRDPR